MYILKTPLLLEPKDNNPKNVVKILIVILLELSSKIVQQPSEYYISLSHTLFTRSIHIVEVLNLIPGPVQSTRNTEGTMTNKGLFFMEFTELHRED